MFIDHATPEDIVEWYENARDVDLWEAEAWHEPGEPVLRNLLEGLESADEAFAIHEDNGRVFMCLGYVSDGVTAYPWTAHTTLVDAKPITAYRIRKRENERLLTTHEQVVSWVRADNERYRKTFKTWGAEISEDKFESFRGVPCFQYRLVA